MRAHLVQFDIRWEDKDANRRLVSDMVTQVDPQRGDLIVLPEMFDTGFSLDTDRTADADEATLQFLGNLARTFGVHVQGGRTVAGRAGALATNRAPILRPDGSLDVEYSKIHPFTYGREPERFQGGDTVVVYDWHADGGGSLRVCPSICYDLRFPELFREGLAMGAEAYALGANWPSARQAHWRALNIARAIENQAFVLSVNRTGSDPHLHYAGGSIAVDPQGRVIGELADDVEVLSVEVDPELVRSWRATFPAWRDARLHPGLASRRDAD